MRRLLAILFIAVFAFACQDEDRKELLTQPEAEKEPDSIQTLEGEFIYVADAAVFRGKDFVYGVTIDSMAEVLADKIRPYKKEDFDMVPVRIEAKISRNTRNEGWDENIEIREIIEILEKEEVSKVQEED